LNSCGVKLDKLSYGRKPEINCKEITNEQSRSTGNNTMRKDKQNKKHNTKR